MKNIFFCVLCVGCLLSFTPVYAQWELGVRLGITANRLSQPVYVFTPSFQAGVYGKYTFAKRFGIQAEVLWGNKGANTFGVVEESVLGNIVISERSDEKIRIQSLDIPVGVHYNIWNKLHIFVGLQPSWVISSRFLEDVQETQRSSTDNSLIQVTRQKKDVDTYNQTSPLEWSYFAGVAYQWQRLNFSLRWVQGITPLNSRPGIDYFSQSIQLGIQYNLWPKKAE
ncbi:MAG TPA: hypothetical protein DCM08_08245 [Microscillaceae bacterium]|jgi:hypothetical protein|nr:hypothetical protein [Microscillaceae bacterium]